MRHWIDDARAVRIEDEIARRGNLLVGKWRHRSGPSPVCGGTDRFSINVAKQVFFCRGCDGRGDIIAMVQWLDGCDIGEACETLTGGRPAEHHRRPVVREAPATAPDTSEADDARQRAAALWGEAIPIAGTLAELYLGARGLAVPPGASGRVVRFHPSCPFGPGVRHPCMVALFREIAGDDPVAIHRTALSPAGEKIDRKALGSIGGAAIKLSADEDVSYGLTIGEGIETTLAGMMLGLGPAWALGTAGAIERFPVLAGIDALTILVDRDPPDRNGRRAGQDSADECAVCWTDAGREVVRIIPNRIGEDFDDVRKSA
jgi:hypothetical protein